MTYDDLNEYLASLDKYLPEHNRLRIASDDSYRLCVERDMFPNIYLNVTLPTSSAEDALIYLKPLLHEILADVWIADMDVTAHVDNGMWYTWDGRKVSIIRIANTYHMVGYNVNGKTEYVGYGAKNVARLIVTHLGYSTSV
jgi:hypothetical protein